MRRSRLRAVLPIAALVAGACSSGASSSDAALEDVGPEVATVGCDDVVRTFVGRERHLPAGHVQLDVFPVSAGGAPVEAADCVTVRDDASGERIESATARGDTARRQLAVVVDPGRDQAQRDQAVAVVEALAANRPDAELALYRWSPATDAMAVPIAHLAVDSPWSVATDPAAVDDNWRQSRFELSGAFASVPLGTSAWPLTDDPTSSLLGRATFDVFELEVGSAELVVEHTHGVQVWLNGVEVATSNLDGSLVVDTAAGRRELRTTVPAELLQSGTNVLAVEMRRTANGDTPELSATLTGTGAQVAPVALIAPNGAAADLDREALSSLDPAQSAPGRLEEALAVVVDDLERTHDDETEALRSVVVVAPATSAPDVDLDGREDAVMIWVGDGDAGAAGFDAVLPSSAGPDVLAAGIHDRLDAVAASRLIVGICSPGARFEAEVEVGVVNLSTNLRQPPPESRGGPCDAAAAAQADDPDPLDAVGLVLDDASRAVWSRRVADNDKTPFRAAIDLGPQWDPAPAEIRLRGQSSLECDRKSYSVNLDGGHRRAVAEEVAVDEFYLVSMCLDEGFVRTHAMLTLLAERGLFPPAFRMVRFAVDGTPAGVYLLVEPPDEALRDAQPQLDGVVRRALDTSFQESTTAWSAVDRDDVVLDEYEAVITTAEEGGPAMVERLGRDLDLDAYLRWLAVMSITDNGDYVDEVFFAGVGTAADGQVTSYWTPMGWDPDDIFTPCHFDDFQFIDPSGLSTCAEARIDHALLSTDAGYAAYVAALDAALAGLTPAHFAGALSATRDRLAALVDDDTAAAMPELAALSATDTSTATGFLEAVDGVIESLDRSFAERHATLLDGVAAAGGDIGISAPSPVDASVPARVLDGQHLPVLLTAPADSGIDRSRNDEVTVRLGDETAVPLQQGVAVAGLVADVPDGTPVLVAGNEVAQVTVQAVADRVAAERIDDDVTWGPDEVVQVDRSLVIGPTGTLTIESGTTVALGPGVNVDVQGVLRAMGAADAPVLLSDLDRATPWGGLRAEGGTMLLDHVMVTGGGGDLARQFGHSDSQPVVSGVGGGRVILDDSVIADSGGKALGIQGARLEMTATVVTRTDTGGEILDGSFTVADSSFLDFPTSEAPFADDDNDAFYLGPTTETSTITNTVFIGGIDDGIDHAGADVVLDRVWIEGFAHECLATSEAGSVTISSSVLRGCDQGLEVGYGTPTVRADHLLLMANGIAFRYGDDYFVPSAGSIEIVDSLLIDNVSGLEVSTDPTALTITGTVSDDPGDEGAGLAVDTPQLNDALVWEAAGPDAPGLDQGWP